MTNNKNKVSTITLIGIMSAVICVLGPLSIPIGPVPVTLTNLAIYIVVGLIGYKKGTISYLIYMLIGAVGIPVFSGFSGGLSKLFGPTGGYLFGFIFMALISGIFFEKFPHNKFMCILGMILGTLVTYAFGTAWLAYQAEMTFYKALTVGVIPFIIGDLLKIVVSVFLVAILRERLKNINR
ncbi:MAG: biotin transporter BioY [Oscillospiraceae bacterium]